jgi:phage-related protein
LAVAAAITAISVAILAVNFAMALNPFSAIAAGIAALVVGVVYAYKTFETFRTIVNSVLNGLISGFETFANAYISAINLIIRGMNLINPFSDIPSLPSLDLGRIGGGTAAAVGSGAAREGGVGQVLASMPAMPSPSAPLALAPSSGGGGGGSSMSKGSQGPGYKAGASGNKFGGGVDVQGGFSINIFGGISTSAEIGKSVVDAIAQYQQVYGPVNFATV